MTAPRPSLYFNFANTPDFLDTRISFLRNTTASFNNRRGQVEFVPANAPRWAFDYSTGECLGLIIEPQKSNSAKYSQDFSNAAWTKSNCSVTANSVAAPDGTVTADTVIAQAAFGGVTQAVTIVSTESVAFSVYAKAATSNFVRVRITDGIDFALAHFNLSDGAVGTISSGGGSCTHFHTHFESLADNWYRCGIVIKTTTNLSYTCSISPTFSDNTAAASTDSVYIWGAQAEAGGMIGVSSYISTTASTVQRDSDCVDASVTVATDKWFNSDSGGMYFEWQNLAPDNTSSLVAGGIGDAFANTIYIVKSSAIISATFARNSVSRTVSDPGSFAIGQRIKAAATWTSTNTDFRVNAGGSNFGSSATSYVPASTLRFSIGHSPWGAPSSFSSAHSFGIFRVAAYFPNRLSSTELDIITT